MTNDETAVPPPSWPRSVPDLRAALRLLLARRPDLLRILTAPPHSEGPAPGRAARE